MLAITLLPVACSESAADEKSATVEDPTSESDVGSSEEEVGEVVEGDSAAPPEDTGEAPVDTGEPAEEVPPAPDVIADSVTGYSGTQGDHGWYYGYVVPAVSADFLMMGNYVASGTDPGWYTGLGGIYWTMIEDDTMHPNGETTTEGRTPVEHWVVRRWVSSYAGEVRILGHVAKIYEDGTTTGVYARVAVDGVDVFAEHVEGWDAVGTDIDVVTTVAAGSTVDLVVEPWESDDRSDRTLFTVRIETVP